VGGEMRPDRPAEEADRTRRAGTEWRTRSAAEGCGTPRRA